MPDKGSLEALNTTKEKEAANWDNAVEEVLAQTYDDLDDWAEALFLGLSGRPRELLVLPEEISKLKILFMQYLNAHLRHVPAVHVKTAQLDLMFEIDRVVNEHIDQKWKEMFADEPQESIPTFWSGWGQGVGNRFEKVYTSVADAFTKLSTDEEGWKKAEEVAEIVKILAKLWGKTTAPPTGQDLTQLASKLFKDKNGRWHMPNGKYAPKVFVKFLGLEW